MKKLTAQEIVVVAFSCKQKRSVLYRTCHSYAKAAKALEDARNKGADFVSIRFIPEATQ